MKKIESRTNPFYKTCKALLSTPGIREHRRFLVSGRKIVPELLFRRDLKPLALLVNDPKDVNQLSFPNHIDVYWFKPDLFDELDEAGTHFPLLLMEAPFIEPHDLLKKPSGLEVVFALSNPLNLGAAIRVCEAFEVSRAILLKECAHPYSPKVIRSSSGSSLNVKLALGPSIKSLTDEHTQMMFALDKFGEDIHHFDWPSEGRLFLGEEGRGIPPEFNFKNKISIPIKAGMDSLNAVSAFSIAIYSYKNSQLRANST